MLSKSPSKNIPGETKLPLEAQKAWDESQASGPLERGAPGVGECASGPSGGLIKPAFPKCLL